MEPKQIVQSSVRSEAIAALLGASAGSGIAWLIWLATKNNGVAIGIAGPIAALTNGFLRKVLK